MPPPHSAPPTWSSGEYVYDGSGNIKNIGWGTAPTLNGDGKSNTYVYDTAGRLVSATANYAADGTETHTYDAFGNMTSVTQWYGYDALNMLRQQSGSRR